MTRFLRILPLLAIAAAILVAPAAAYKVGKDPLPPAGQVGVPYTHTFTAVGGTGPHSFAVIAGSLPPGLSLATDGTLSGTPTQAGAFSFYVEAVDSATPTPSRTQVKFTIDISTKLTITTWSLPAATRGVPYSTQLTVSGGTANSWSVKSGTLPSGLSISNAGVISGTPTAEGASTFTLLASDGTKSDTKTLTLEVTRPLSVSASAFPPLVVGKQFTARLDVGGGSGSYSYALAGGQLPTGLALDAEEGIISGVPRKAGAFVADIQVSTSGGSAAHQPLKLVVKPQLGFATLVLPSGKVGRRYSSQIVVRGGIAPVALTSPSVFPPGVVLDGETGVLSGKPRQAGTYRVIVTLKDSYGGVASKRYTILIRR
ncbi:MAG: Ig domain-containing protein [Gaiellales bacterium]